MAFGDDGRADTMGLRADWRSLRPILPVRPCCGRTSPVIGLHEGRLFRHVGSGAGLSRSMRRSMSANSSRGIPPYTVAPENMESYRGLGERIEKANSRFDFAESERLSVEQMELVNFTPIMTHSFEENAKTVVFHAQLLADFNTVDEMGRKMLEELNR